MSDDDNERDSGGFQHENAFDLSPEWGPARLDRRHQFNGYAMVFLPYDFDVSTGFRFLSGRPDRRDAWARDANGDRGGPDRPFSAPGVPFTRNAFRNEPFNDVNLRLQWGSTFDGRASCCLIGRGLQLVQLGQHRVGRHDGDQLLRGDGPGRLRLRRADQPELPVADRQQPDIVDVRPADSDEHILARRDRFSSDCGSCSETRPSGHRRPGACGRLAAVWRSTPRDAVQRQMPGPRVRSTSAAITPKAFQFGSAAMRVRRSQARSPSPAAT